MTRIIIFLEDTRWRERDDSHCPPSLRCRKWTEILEEKTLAAQIFFAVWIVMWSYDSYAYSYGLTILAWHVPFGNLWEIFGS